VRRDQFVKLGRRHQFNGVVEHVENALVSKLPKGHPELDGHGIRNDRARKNCGYPGGPGGAVRRPSWSEISGPVVGSVQQVYGSWQP
jgi:hypothetical protein